MRASAMARSITPLGPGGSTMTAVQSRSPASPSRDHGRGHAPSWLTQAGILMRKDVAIELRTGEVLVTSGFFAVLVVVLGSLSFYVGPDTKSQVAAGVVWLAVAFPT